MTDVMKYLEKDLIKLGVKHKFNEVMANYTSFKIGGQCDVMVFPSRFYQVFQVACLAKRYELPISVISGGSKVLVNDKGIRGIVVCFSKDFSKVTLEDNEIFAEAGASLGQLFSISCNNNLSGFENLVGVPACLGGMISTNAGAFNQSVSDIIKEVTVLGGGEIYTLKNNQMNFSYRDSRIKHTDEIVLCAKLGLMEKSKEEILERAKNCIEYRKRRQPIGQNSCGSIFKNGEGYFAGQLIEGLGLLGMGIGGVAISRKHGNFIVNVGEGKCEDVMKIIDIVKEKVYNRYKVELHNEVVFL